MTPARKRQAFRRGHAAELLCLWHLRLRGYRILARRFRVPSGEIDLIARRGRVLAAIEVKARASLATASESVSGSTSPMPGAATFPRSRGRRHQVLRRDRIDFAPRQQTTFDRS